MKRFECQQCGGCCRQNGDLRLLPEDIDKIASYFGISNEDMINRYNINNIDGKLYFIDTHGCCPFLAEDNKCSIQEAKPFFCAKYIPFVDTEGSKIYSVCEGIGKGKEWTEEEIQARYSEMLDKLVIIRTRGDA